MLNSSLMRERLASVIAATSLFTMLSCGASSDIVALGYVCGSASSPASPASTAATVPACGADDPNLPPEPTFPTDICQTLEADKATPDEDHLDTERVQAALTACTGRAVKLTSRGANHAFITGHLEVASVTLWIDAGVTLYASAILRFMTRQGAAVSSG